MKLQKNFDKNKFGLAKKLLISKSLLLINKKVLLVDKKMCGEARRKGTPPDTTTHIHNNVPHTQRNITKTDMAKNHIRSCYIYFPHVSNKKKLPPYKKQRVSTQDKRKKTRYLIKVYIALAAKKAQLAVASINFIVSRLSVLPLINQAAIKQIHPNTKTINVPLLII